MDLVFGKWQSSDGKVLSEEVLEAWLTAVYQHLLGQDQLLAEWVLAGLGQVGQADQLSMTLPDQGWGVLPEHQVTDLMEYLEDVLMDLATNQELLAETRQEILEFSAVRDQAEEDYMDALGEGVEPKQVEPLLHALEVSRLDLEEMLLEAKRLAEEQAQLYDRLAGLLRQALPQG